MFSWWRARKKKVLINLPFVNRLIKKVPEKPTPPPTKEAKPAIIKDEAVKQNTTNSKETTKKATTKSAPAKLVNIKNIVLSNSVSINSKTFKEEQEKKSIAEKDTDLSKRPTDNYSIEQFNKKWDLYKDKLLKKGKVSLVTVFEYIPPVNNDTIELLVENKALEEEFNHNKADFIEYIRTELNNFNIQVTTQINKEFKTKKAYTPQEKYEKMLEKNPSLELLKRKLDMDVGYV